MTRRYGSRSRVYLFAATCGLFSTVACNARIPAAARGCRGEGWQQVHRFGPPLVASCLLQIRSIPHGGSET